jgi:hypothetical protein
LDPSRGHNPGVGGGRPVSGSRGVAASLRVLDPPIAGGLVETIVGDVTGAFFGD